MQLFNKSIFIGLASGILWAFDTILVDYNISNINYLKYTIIFSICIAFLHDFFSSIWLFLYIIISGKKNILIQSFKKSDSYVICLAALSGGPIGMTCYILAIYHSNASIAATISTIYPALGCLFAYIFLKIKTTITNFIGLLLVIITTAYIGLNLESFDQISFLGFLFALGCAIGWGLESTICSYALKNDLNYNIALFLRQLTSSIIYLLIITFFLKKELPNVIELILHNSLILKMAVIAIFGSLSYLFYYKAIGELGPIKAMGLNISYSAWAILLGPFLGYTLSPLLLVLSITIIIGALITNLQPKEAIIK
ncbi:DMT family transporter [Providencia rettgeri]|uniref:DMT family transporter n=1 Tax=Providencia TaxID=586 RepID=UPI0029416C8D|nr:EamA family transporter [Providencia stuartii]ELR5132696.1 DMT family transporter [Providencia rettgeri]